MTLEQTSRGAGLAYLFLTFFMWGSVYVAGKLGSAQTSPFLLAVLLLHERITPVKPLCLALAVIVTVIVAGGARGQAEILGILATLLATLTWGAASVFVRKLTAKYPARLVTAYGMTLSLIFHLPTAILAALRQPTRLDAGGALTVLYLGIVGSALSQLSWAKALSRFPASTCSLFYPLQAVFSALLGAVILNEKFTAAFFLGLAFVIADVALSTWAAARETESAK